MTHRQPIPTLTAVLVAVVVLAAVSGAGAAAQTDDPGVRVTDGTTTSGGNTTVGVVLTSAPNGLSGYYLDLTVQSPEGARVVNASYPDQFGLTTAPAYSEDGTTVTVEAADVNDVVEPGAADIQLATVEIAGGTPGDLAVGVEPRQFDDDDGESFQPAQVSDETPTTEPDTPTTSTGPEPTDGQGAANGSATASGGSGPLSPALVVGAVALLVGVWFRRSEA
ncbi:cell surface protein [Haloarcula salinisoli]|uniref:Cell surface protein n=1 Tax=Haloarcula salinisoli TaxID=2487746 RepID=A0A8J7YMC3_9EURY|nr:cell surface protein [Halomicroarcula salinisoli]MBX0305859.1 cell surface protein [Halomicroarcula salinisoli]